MSRFHKGVALIAAIWAADILIHGLVRGATVHHPNSPAMQALQGLS